MIKSAQFRFYASLNDFLPPERRQRSFAHAFEFRPSLKDVIEALGVPHTEVDLLLANGEPVAFDRTLGPGDRISVFPRFRSVDIRQMTQVRPSVPRGTRFVIDVHLGRLARYLRLLGFDALYRNDYRDLDLARIAQAQERILLTKDRRLLCRSLVTHGYYVRSTKAREQVLEVMDRFDLELSLNPFQRCLECNAVLRAAEPEVVAERVPSNSRQAYSAFRSCPECHRVYWPGSHYQHMRRFIGGLTHSHQRLDG